MKENISIHNKKNKKIMKIYSLENTELLENNLYDLIYPFLVEPEDTNIVIKEYKVPINREMRIDLICMDIYGNTDYIDELMFMNGIVDPYSIKVGDIIYYTDNIKSYEKDYESNKETTLDDRESSINNTSTDVYVDKDRNKIIIPTKLR